MNGFIPIGTNFRFHQRPLTIIEAIDRIQSWLNQPCVRIIQPTDYHWMILQTLLRESKAVGNLARDAHLAALALEHNCILHSSDTNFARFRRLKWKNPIAEA